MATDPMNFDQFTWKQLRSQVHSFKSTTSQFTDYLVERGLINTQAEEKVRRVFVLQEIALWCRG